MTHSLRSDSLVQGLLEGATNYFRAAQTAAGFGAETGLKTSILFLKTGNMSKQFFHISHAHKIPAQHFVRPQRRLTTRPQ